LNGADTYSYLSRHINIVKHGGHIESNTVVLDTWIRTRQQTNIAGLSTML